jgi:FkbH-like protein
MAKTEHYHNSADFQKTENPHISLYIKQLVYKFRNYNNDNFVISISGLNKFIDSSDAVLSQLTEQLKNKNFTIKFESNAESISQIGVTCKNDKNNISFDFEYSIQNLPILIELSSKTDIPVVVIIVMKILAYIIAKSKILYKAIVLDLDETLWQGTLVEIGINQIKENLQSKQGIQFISFMKFVKTLANELGIYISICSRNDAKFVETAIEQMDENTFPLKNQIDFIIANHNDKSENIKKIAEQLSILPESIVFIDDNQIVRDEVKTKLPSVFVPEWSNHSELITQLLVGCVFERTELSLNSQNRRKQYQIIQTERHQNSLPKLHIKVIKDNNHTESIKLYSKSNQFKLSRNDDNFDSNSKSLYFEICRENGENLGICSAITFTVSEYALIVHNWAISCRYFEIGLEESILLYMQNIANSKKILINFQQSEYNLKMTELMEKYSIFFIKNDQFNMIEIKNIKETRDILTNNTNLKEIKNR